MNFKEASNIDRRESHFVKYRPPTSLHFQYCIDIRCLKIPFLMDWCPYMIGVRKGKRKRFPSLWSARKLMGFFVAGAIWATFSCKIEQMSLMEYFTVWKRNIEWLCFCYSTSVPVRHREIKCNYVLLIPARNWKMWKSNYEKNEEVWKCQYANIQNGKYEKIYMS